MPTQVLYFGYGANRDPQMMEAIIGRVPQGYPATFSGFELCIEHWSEMQPEVQKLLLGSWDEDFRSYVVRPTTNSSKRVKGIVWLLTPNERRLIDAWELTGSWYNTLVLQIQDGPKSKKQIEVQIVNDRPVEQVVSGMRYKTFLNK